VVARAAAKASPLTMGMSTQRTGSTDRVTTATAADEVELAGAAPIMA
jgi:hypothetical protein